MSRQVNNNWSDDEAKKHRLSLLVAAGMAMIPLSAMAYYMAASPHVSLSWSNSIDLIALPLIIILSLLFARWAARRPFGPLDEHSEGWHQFKRTLAAVTPMLLLFSLAAIDLEMSTGQAVTVYISTIFKVTFFTLVGLALFEWFFNRNGALCQWARSFLPFGASR